MKSSTGQYFMGLDHIRALAAFMVFTWHFTHYVRGYPVPFEYVPVIFPLAIFDEGHTGVALFMTLSGYLFAKLLDNKKINYKSFIWNRLLRLAPLLLVVIFIVGLKRYIAEGDMLEYSKEIMSGLVIPSLPNGGWSITVEFHFYLLLPLLLFLNRSSKYLLFFIILLVILIRYLLYIALGEIQSLSYWTILGRIDQFVFGIIAFHFSSYIKGKHVLAFIIFTAFSIFYWYFDTIGGFYQNPIYPSSSSLWVIIPTIEGLSYSLLIAWYDNSFKHSTGKLSKFISTIGTYSYSIYLFHFFVVFKFAHAIDKHVIELSNFYLALVFSAICFLLMMPIGYLSYRFIESPFLKLRTSYIISKTR